MTQIPRPSSGRCRGDSHCSVSPRIVSQHPAEQCRCKPCRISPIVISEYSKLTPARQQPELHVSARQAFHKSPMTAFHENPMTAYLQPHFLLVIFKCGNYKPEISSTWGQDLLQDPSCCCTFGKVVHRSTHQMIPREQIGSRAPCSPSRLIQHNPAVPLRHTCSLYCSCRMFASCQRRQKSSDAGGLGVPNICHSNHVGERLQGSVEVQRRSSEKVDPGSSDSLGVPSRFAMASRAGRGIVVSS